MANIVTVASQTRKQNTPRKLKDWSFFNSRRIWDSECRNGTGNPRILLEFGSLKQSRVNLEGFGGDIIEPRCLNWVCGGGFIEGGGGARSNQRSGLAACIDPKTSKRTWTVHTRSRLPANSLFPVMVPWSPQFYRQLKFPPRHHVGKPTFAITLSTLKWPK